MSHRLQITLEDAQYERLRGESDRTGASIAELVRRALAGTLDSSSAEERLRKLEASFGAWSDRPASTRVESGASYVDAVRNRHRTS